MGFERARLYSLLKKAVSVLFCFLVRPFLAGG